MSASRRRTLTMTAPCPPEGLLSRAGAAHHPHPPNQGRDPRKITTKTPTQMLSIHEFSRRILLRQSIVRMLLMPARRAALPSHLWRRAHPEQHRGQSGGRPPGHPRSQSTRGRNHSSLSTLTPCHAGAPTRHTTLCHARALVTAIT